MKHVLIFQINLINIMQRELTTSLTCMTCLYSNENRGMETDDAMAEKDAGIVTSSSSNKDTQQEK